MIVKEVIKKLNMPEEHKAVIIDFLAKMLEIRPEKRLSVEEALNHSIFSLDYNKDIFVNNSNSTEVMKKLLQYRVRILLFRSKTTSRHCFILMLP